jgi:hypothetical protein
VWQFERVEKQTEFDVELAKEEAILDMERTVSV